MATLEGLRLAGFVSGRLPAVVAAAGSGLDSGGLRAARFAYERRPRNLIWEEASVDLKQLTHRLKNLVGRPGTPEPAEQSGGDPPAAPTDGGPGSGTLPARESVPVPGGQADAGAANVATMQDYGSPPESGAAGPEAGGSGPAHAS